MSFRNALELTNQAAVLLLEHINALPRIEVLRYAPAVLVHLDHVVERRVTGRLDVLAHLFFDLLLVQLVVLLLLDRLR